jgi:peptidoglycan/xylan/chitin deacetylase (PgdA/CDA1 family)
VRAPPFVKDLVYRTAHLSGLSRALGIRYRGYGVIFALHSVVADDAFFPDQSLRCPLGTLERSLRCLKKQGVEFVTLDDVVNRLEYRGIKGKRPFAAFTFDDGYADNLTRALPIMEKYAAPFTLYATTGMITREIDGWWFGLAQLIRSQQRIKVAGLGQFDCEDPPSKRRVYARVETAVHRNFDLLPALHEAIKTGNIKIDALVDREALTEQQLRMLSYHPLVTIGGHTTTHKNLARSPVETARAEMAHNRTYLEKLSGKPVLHFAYPFGHAGACGDREAKISRSVGFHTSVTTRAGMLFPAHRDHLHALPRICLEWGENESTLHCKLNGLSRVINSRLGNPVARM